MVGSDHGWTSHIAGFDDRGRGRATGRLGDGRRGCLRAVLLTARGRRRILVVEGSSVAPGYARALVSAGPFEKAYGNGGTDGWFV